MHIPDNYLSPETCAVMGAAMIPVWAIATKRIKEELSAKKIPLVGITAAFSFLIMMFNVPLPGGTTGHAVGATLVAILIGPFSACISVTIALLVQALFFGDGGILAFGANCFNMAFVMPFAGYYLYKLLKSFLKNEAGNYASAFVAAYVAINIAAFCAAFELGIQPFFFRDAAGLPLYCPYPLAVSIPAMLVPHLLVAGVIEAIVTAGVCVYVTKLAPDNIHGNREDVPKTKPLYILLLVMTFLAPLGLLAVGTAWGEWTSDELKNLIGYVPSAMKNGFNYAAPMSDYSLPVVKNGIIGYIVSAILGVAVILILFKIVSAIIPKSANDKK